MRFPIGSGVWHDYLSILQNWVWMGKNMKDYTWSTFFMRTACWVLEKTGWLGPLGALCLSPHYRMYECESWTIKKAECWRIDAFELWYQRKLLRVPWTARKSNQSVLKEISPECSFEGLMLKLKLQYFGHLMRANSLEKTLMLGRIEGGGEWDDRGWEGWMASLTQ